MAKISKSELIDQVYGLVGGYSFVYIKDKKNTLVEIPLETFSVSDLHQLKNKIERAIDPIFEPQVDKDEEGKKDPRILTEDFRAYFGIDVDGGRFKNNPTGREGSGYPGVGGAERHTQSYRPGSERLGF